MSDDEPLTMSMFATRADLERARAARAKATDDGSQTPPASDEEMRETGEARPERPDPQLHKGERR